MMRVVALALLLANLGYFAWSQGHLQPLGWGPTPVNEPERLGRQIQPEVLQLLSPEALARAEVPLPASRSCWQVGWFDEAQARALGRVLETSLPADSWQWESVNQPERWIIYMGKYDSPEALAKKRGELRYLNVPSEPVGNPTLEPGLSLGAFDNQAAANTALAQLAQRGVRTARVVQERAASAAMRLRLPQADEAMRNQLESLKPLLVGRVLQSCPP